MIKKLQNIGSRSLLLTLGIFIVSSLASCQLQHSLAKEPVQVTMSTSLGEILLAIDVENAPLSAANFLALVDGGYYDGTSFYRTVTPENDRGLPKIQVIQGGLSPAESPLPPIAHETTEQTGLAHVDGALSLARGDVGTASSEFFICIGAQPGLDFGEGRNPDQQGFAVFGRVIAGMKVVHAIADQPADGASESDYTAGQILTTPLRIVSIRRAD